MSVIVASSSRPFAPLATESATTYVALDGNDANDGLSWRTAKKTIPVAIEALPVGAERQPNGIVEVGWGEFVVSSTARVDTVKPVVLNEGEKTSLIEDASVTNADVGSYVYGGVYRTDLSAGYLVDAARITSVEVKEGKKYFTINQKTGEKLKTVTIVKPAIVLPAGVVLRGRGRQNGHEAITSKNYPTLIKDEGTGITIQAESGKGEYPSGELVTYAHVVVENIAALGNPNNLMGFAAASIYGVHVSRCSFHKHGQIGLYLGNFAPVMGYILGTECFENGTSESTGITGGIITKGNPNNFTIMASRCIKNYGVGSQLTGVHTIGFGCSGALKSKWGSSGIGCIAGSAETDGPVTHQGMWMEGNEQTAMRCSAIQLVHLIGCVFKGTSPFSGEGAEYGIENQGGTVILDGCNFFQSKVASILTEADKGYVHWKGCESSDPFWIKCKAKGGFASQTLAAVTSNGVGTFVGGLEANPKITTPKEASKVTLTSGVAWQNTQEKDVRIVVPITYEANGEVIIARGPTSSPTALGTAKKTAAGTDVIEFYVPNHWYFELTATKASLGEATVQPA